MAAFTQEQKTLWDPEIIFSVLERHLSLGHTCKKFYIHNLTHFSRLKWCVSSDSSTARGRYVFLLNIDIHCKNMVYNVAFNVAAVPYELPEHWWFLALKCVFLYTFFELIWDTHTFHWTKNKYLMFSVTMSWTVFMEMTLPLKKDCVLV